VSHKLLVTDSSGQREVLLVGTMTVGRDPRCDISDADPLLSRRHAEFVVSDSGVLVRDLDSRNGILVNGRKTPHALLQPGDVVQVSGLAITLISTIPKSPPSPPAGEPDDDKTLLRIPPASGPKDERLPAPSDGIPVAGGSGEPTASDQTIRVPRRQDGAVPSGPAAVPAAAAVTPERPPPLPGQIHAADQVAPGGRAGAASTGRAAGEPTAGGPLERLVAGPPAAGRELPPPPRANAVPAPPGPPAAAASDDDRTRFFPPPGTPVPPIPTASDDDRTRFFPPPGAEAVLPPRPVRSAPSGPATTRSTAAPVPQAAIARAVVTPTRAPSKARTPWGLRLTALAIGAAVWGALAGVVLAELSANAALALVAAILVAIVGAVGIGVLLRRAFNRAMAALTDDVDLAVIGRLEEVGDPFGDQAARDLADAVNELVARVRAGRPGPPEP